MKDIKITEAEAVRRLKDYIDDCDGDELARLLGECFSGECFQNSRHPGEYDFTPNDYYGGEFDDLK